jgi:4-amino-4-deoxy-L-arabinose transferase-like glycosyltransferase
VDWRKKQNILHFLPGVLCLLVIGFYNLLTFNKFYPITEGWFSFYGEAIRQGQVPYRDFYLFLPPFYPIFLSLFSDLFGVGFVKLRILGVILILFFSSGLFLIYVRFFNRWVAGFITVVTMVYYQANNAHISYDFTQFLSAFAVFQVYFFIRHLDREPGDPEAMRERINLFLAGFLGGLSFLTKSSNAIMIIGFCFLGLLLTLTPRNLKSYARSLIFYFMGFAASLLPFCFWLLIHGAFSDAIHQIFGGAIESKGTLGVILFAWVKNLLIDQFFYQCRQIFILLALLGYPLWFFSREPFFLSVKQTATRFRDVGLGIVVFGAPLVALSWPMKNPVTNLWMIDYGKLYWNYSIVAGFLVSWLIIFYFLFQAMTGKPWPHRKWLFISIASLGFIYGTGTSAGITSVGAFLGLGVFLGLVLSLKSIFYIGTLGFFIFSLNFLIFLAETKMEKPYHWWGAESGDVRGKLVHSTELWLKGIWLDPQANELITRINGAVRSSTGPKDKILAFPHIPVFYLFNERWPVGKAYVHWFDFLPDRFAKEEAQLILRARPKAIVYLDLGPAAIDAHERLFRGGRPCGQRDIIQAIKTLTSPGGGYLLVETIQASQDAVANVWIRK